LPRDLRKLWKARMLGPEEYEIRLAIHLNGSPTQLASWSGTLHHLDQIGSATAPNPSQANPLVLQALFSQGLPVVTLQAVPRSLEQVYLQAINAR